MDRNKSDCSYEIADELGTLSTSPKGWKKEAGGSPSAKPKPRTCARSCSSISRIGAEKKQRGYRKRRRYPFCGFYLHLVVSALLASPSSPFPCNMV